MQIAVRRRVVPPGFRWRIYQDDTDVVDPENAGSAPGIELITGRQAKEGEVIHNILRAAIRRDNGESGKQTPRAGDHGGVIGMRIKRGSFRRNHTHL
ncbi:hypothetical protein OIU89_24610 [Escherichia coli]|nr:hypothetical protein [Escherichia coli]